MSKKRPRKDKDLDSLATLELYKWGQARRFYFEHWLGVVVTKNASKTTNTVIPSLENAEVKILEVTKQGPVRGAPPGEWLVITVEKHPFVEFDCTGDYPRPNTQIKEEFHVFSVIQKSMLFSSRKKIKLSQPMGFQTSGDAFEKEFVQATKVDLEVFAVHYRGQPTVRGNVAKLEDPKSKKTTKFKILESEVVYRLIKPPDGSELKLPERAILESRYSYMQDLMQNMGLISNPTRPKTNEANKPFAEDKNSIGKNGQKLDEYLNEWNVKEVIGAKDESESYENISSAISENITMGFQNYLNIN